MSNQNDITKFEKIDGETGEVKLSVTKTGGGLSALGKEFVVLTQDKASAVAATNLSRTAYRLLFWIFANLDWNDEVLGTPAGIARYLGLDRSSVSKALAELEKHHLIHRTKRYGSTVITSNTDLATKGKNARFKRQHYAELGTQSYKILLAKVVDFYADAENASWFRDADEIRRLGTSSEQKDFFARFPRPKTRDEVQAQILDDISSGSTTLEQLAAEIPNRS